MAAAIGGVPDSSELAASDTLPEPAGDTRQLAALVRRALEHRHEVIASRLQSNAAEARVRATRKRYLPEPELGIGYQRWTNIAGLPSSSAGGALLASASIPLPLFDRGQGTVDRSLHESSAARVRERDTKNAVQREVELALRKLRLIADAPSLTAPRRSKPNKYAAPSWSCSTRTTATCASKNNRSSSGAPRSKPA